MKLCTISAFQLFAAMDGILQKGEEEDAPVRQHRKARSGGKGGAAGGAGTNMNQAGARPKEVLTKAFDCNSSEQPSVSTVNQPTMQDKARYQNYSNKKTVINHVS